MNDCVWVYVQGKKIHFKGFKTKFKQIKSLIKHSYVDVVIKKICYVAIALVLNIKPRFMISAHLCFLTDWSGLGLLQLQENVLVLWTDCNRLIRDEIERMCPIYIWSWIEWSFKLPFERDLKLWHYWSTSVSVEQLLTGTQTFRLQTKIWIGDSCRIWLEGLAVGCCSFSWK